MLDNASSAGGCYLGGMKRVANPYRPGFNQPPAALTGRDKVVAAFTEALDVAALDGRTPRPVILTGGRGVGKTVLLGEASVIAAEKHSWLTVPIEIRPGRSFTPQLLERLGAARDLYRQTPQGKHLEIAGAKIRATVLGVGGEIELRRGERAEPALALEALLAETVEAAGVHEAGLVVTIDELQFAGRSELADFAATVQQHVPDNWPLVIVLAGLPSIRDTQRGVTYLERGEWHVLGLLDAGATRAALAEPAEAAGRPMSPDACGLLAEASGGYPYAIQVMGHHAWRASSTCHTIEASHATVAVAAAEADLAAGLYESRWQDASPKEREYLMALAQLASDHYDVTAAEVAGSLGKTTKAVSYLRDRLTQKGTIFAESGALRLAVPGMTAWILHSNQLDSDAEPGLRRGDKVTLRRVDSRDGDE